jgi:hypothetical protein
MPHLQGSSRREPTVSRLVNQSLCESNARHLWVAARPDVPKNENLLAIESMTNFPKQSSNFLTLE